jgi:flagellar basal-body rod protein FlgC
MGNFSSIDISSSGLLAQRVRLDAIANNIANVNTTRTDAGGPYKRQEVVFRAHSGELSSDNGGVQVDGVIESSEAPKRVHDPSHPDAGPDGVVELPNINIVEEMVDMIAATRAYEANVQAISASRAMVNKALDIGRV